MCMHYAPDATREELFAEHKSFGDMHESDLAPLYKKGHDFSTARKIRIGIVSGDFRFHAMLFFLLPILEARDKESWEIFCYSTTARPDGHTKSFRAAADKWREVRSLASQDLAFLIAGDDIDILIDLSGHAPNNRLLTFAAKPAPLQVAWGDYVDTRGLRTVDIFLGDAVHSPAIEDQYYLERVVRFAPDYVCYQPPSYAPPVTTPPHLKNDCLTFGTFSEITKIGPTSVALWATVLRAIPDARFLLNGHLLSDELARAPS